MATATPVLPTPAASEPGVNEPMIQNANAPSLPFHQNAYMMPVAQQGSITPHVRPVPGVLCLSIGFIVTGVVIVVLGIIAIVLRSLNSFIGYPIWTGLLFWVTTGILGICVHKKRNNFNMNIAFLIMIVISSASAGQLMVHAWTFAAIEKLLYGCLPNPYLFSDRDYYCRFPKEALIAVSVFIGVCALIALVLCIISFSVTLYVTCMCCYNCCKCCRKGSQSPTMVQYSNHTGIIMTPLASNDTCCRQL